ncbi:Alpha/Beta hydrolase protein [Fimicolochytrium jonesii]|uniref:Alpha/Beta hydrolase protein n=1 Tax=Fimicolochytrium jonesii TaxID=1396493 RepID=UPI0022FF2E21|nr:Alpha/Beta hydrolase protein [Fimicolochytrium jonesii]KAI8818824.1 Alpha/Beta hydrolase protein [Fimicolochytrium jonesii]
MTSGSEDKPKKEPSAVAKLYSSIATLPSFSSALIFPSTKPGTARVVVSGTVRDLNRNTRRKLVSEITVAEEGKEVLAEPFTSEVSDGAGLLVQFRDGKRWVQLKTVDDKEKGKRFFVEVWSSGRIVKSIEVTESHKAFYEDDWFGSIVLSSDEEKVAYVAERKLPDEKGPEKFVFRPDWGEKFNKKGAPSIVICDLESEEIRVLKEFDDLAVGAVQFGPKDESLIFWGVRTNPRQYGILFCPNRVSGIYQSDLEGNGLKLLTDPNEASRSPRLDAKKETLYFISNPIGGPHFTCGKISSISLGGKAEIKSVLPYVETPGPSDFPGLFIDRIPINGIVETGDARWIVVTNTWRSRVTIAAINVASGKVVDLCPKVETGSWRAIGVHGTWVAAIRSEPGVPQVVHVGVLKLTSDSASIAFHSIHAPSPAPPPIKWRTLTFPDRSSILEAILVTPISPQPKTLVKGTKPPLLVFPHGGPHGSFATEFYLYNYLLTRVGFALLMVNYRGSTGFGKGGIESLIGRVGDLDVEDTQYVAEEVRKSGEVDPDRVALWGGSHGGFLTAWLVGKYPDYYKAAVLRNPVINMGSNLAQSDIPDWSLAEAGIEYDLTQPPLVTPEIYASLWKASPFSVAAAVKTPSLVMLGSDDRRVPNYEGLNWYYYLKGRGVDVRAMMFPDNGHALDGVETEKHGFEALTHFLLEFVAHKLGSVAPSRGPGDTYGDIGE